MGGGGSPKKNWLNTAGWPEQIADAQLKKIYNVKRIRNTCI